MQANTFYWPWEVQVLEWLQQNLGGGIAKAVSFLSFFGEETFLIMLLGFLYWCWNKQTGTRVGMAVLMGTVWNPMLKNLVFRIRPYMAHESIENFRTVSSEGAADSVSAQGYSFPSGHSTNVVTSLTATGLELRKKWMTALAVVFPLLVGLSRMAVGAHYPTDVLAGWLLGLGTVALVRFLQRKIRSEAVLYGVLLLTALPGFFYCRTDDFFTCAGLLFGCAAGAFFEKRFVRFENTRSAVRIVLRMAGGVLVYLALNSLMKLPFPEDFLQGGTTAAFLVRAARYLVIGFAEFGVYPMAFCLWDRAARKRGREQRRDPA